MTTVDVPPAPELKGSILLVCSGNICRSPAAAALLAMALGPLPVEIHSAGLMARDGMGVEPKMAAALGDRVDQAALSRFCSRRVTAEILSEADVILTATRNQRADTVRLAPSAVRNTFTLQEFSELAVAVSAWLKQTGEPKPHTISDFVDLVPQVRGTRTLKGDLSIGDPMGRSRRIHVKVAAEIERSVAMISQALLN